MIVGSIALSAQQSGPPQVTYQDIAAGLKDPSKWLTYSGTYDGQRHSPLTQITPANVHQLSAQWTFQTGVLGAFQATPIVIDGVIYITGFNNNAWAIDARSGRQIWRYRRELPDEMILCCGPVNRGFAVLGDRLFMTTLDAHLVSLDMKTGAVLFDVALEDYKRGYSATVAPLVVKDKVILGIAGAEFGIRGFIEAFDAATGKKIWRFYTVAGPGEVRRQHLAEDRCLYARRRLDLGHGHLRSRAEPGVLRHRQSRAGLLQRQSRRRQPVHRVDRRARCRHRQAEVALPVHAARRARLGRDAGAGAGRAADRRPDPQGGDVREPQRVLLHDRSRDRKADRRQAVRRNDVGEGDQLA